ncbi:unnamed protein product, partial [Iphiclides podalirius]
MLCINTARVRVTSRGQLSPDRTAGVKKASPAGGRWQRRARAAFLCGGAPRAHTRVPTRCNTAELWGTVASSAAVPSVGHRQSVGCLERMRSAFINNAGGSGPASCRRRSNTNWIRAKSTRHCHTTQAVCKPRTDQTAKTRGFWLAHRFCVS